MSKGKKKIAPPLTEPIQPLSEKAYEKELRHLHEELVKLQQWVVHKGLKVCIVFEGRDGAGKGGTIKAITERVSPRVFRVMALPAPTEREKTQMYAQRYLPHLPAAGEVVIFDRSWYNRAGVERVMGFCSDEQADKFLAVTPLFERMMVDGVEWPPQPSHRLDPGPRRLSVSYAALNFRSPNKLRYRYRLSGLLRGQGGSERLAASGHAAGADFVLLDQALVQLPLASDAIARPLSLRVGDATAGISVARARRRKMNTTMITSTRASNRVCSISLMPSVTAKVVSRETT